MRLSQWGVFNVPKTCIRDLVSFKDSAIKNSAGAPLLMTSTQELNKTLKDLVQKLPQYQNVLIYTYM